MQWSAPITGWLERNWIEAGVSYIRIDSTENRRGDTPISTGLVLDTLKRNRHCCDQVNQLMALASTGIVTSKDILYFDDFWHFDIQALAYHFHMLNIAPKMYAFCHAQSVDEFDFTYPMRHWMRDFERGIGKILSGIFVNSDLLKQLLTEEGIGTEETVHVIGHIFCEKEVRERFPKVHGRQKKFQRENTVIFSSRWDDEKNPLFFLDIMRETVKNRKDIKFIVCTSSQKLRSNNLVNLTRLQWALKQYPNNLFLKEGLTKEEYYIELLKAKIQINTASQDWISIALLEASVAGCYPLYPYFRSFPQALLDDDNFMYKHLALESAVEKLQSIIDDPTLWSRESIQARAWIHQRHNMSWARMINIMFDKQIIGVLDYAQMQEDRNGFTRNPALLLDLLASVSNIEGDIAEVGVHRAHKYLLFLDEAEKQNKICHAIDSFKGFAEPSKYDEGYPKGQLDTGGADWLRKMVAHKKQAVILEGWIPDVLQRSRINQLSFVHIDVDQYLPTKQTIEWAYPLLAIGGIMVCHDYLPGHKINCSRAIDEFMNTTGLKYSGLKNTWAWWIKR